MCGIAGIWDRQAQQAPGTLAGVAEAMAETLRHRGPDAGAVWCDAAAGVALGHRRLSIIDPSPAGAQPMVSSCGRFVLSYNGELYNTPELRAELETAGRPFRGHSDTEVIVEGVATWGIEATVRRLLGMFAMAVWDGRERALYLIRDRLGIKPLYWMEAGGRFLFGSELKALRADRGWSPTLHHDAVAAFMRLGYVPAPLSIYRGVHKLPPATILTLRAAGAPSIRAFWSLEDVARAGQAARLAVSDEEAAERLDRLLRDTVRRHMVADVPLGAFLSGGIDSSAVVAAMQAESARPVRTFSIGFHEPAYDETPHAAAVARHLGTDHQQLYVAPDQALAVIARLPDMYDEPFADSSQIPTFLLAGMTRRHVTVALSGDGGDELFAGYSRYFTAEPVVARSATVGRALYRLLVSQWPAPARVVRDANVPRGPLDDPGINDLVPDPVERMQYLDTLTYLPDDILTKVDRASMAVSLEARVPLLDHRLVEFAWTLAPAWKGRDGIGRRLLRRVLDRYVPRTLVDRPKVGFAPPINAWLRGRLRDWAEVLLDEKRLGADGVLHPGPIRAAWQAHLSGNGEALEPPHALWAVLMFQAWKQHWLP